MEPFPASSAFTQATPFVFMSFHGKTLRLTKCHSLDKPPAGSGVAFVQAVGNTAVVAPLNFRYPVGGKEAPLGGLCVALGRVCPVRADGGRPRAA